METSVAVLIMGIGATALTDIWALARRRLFGTPLPDWALVGRWAGHVVRGRFWHVAISRAPAVRGERALGWITHYLVGIMFAVLLPLFWGSQWVANPRLVPALLVGLLSVAAPFFILQPAMGAGVAASRTSRPWHARFQSLTTHVVFGLGLFASAWTYRS
jgi:hypothetical protein